MSNLVHGTLWEIGTSVGELYVKDMMFLCQKLGGSGMDDF